MPAGRCGRLDVSIDRLWNTLQVDDEVMDDTNFPNCFALFLTRIRSSRSLCDVQEPLVVPCIVSFALAIVWSGKAPKPRWKPGQLTFVSVHSPCAMDGKFSLTHILASCIRALRTLVGT